MISIEPELKILCNITEVLEYLALGWEPCVANDERLLPQERVRVCFDGTKKDHDIDICGGMPYRINYSFEEQEYINKMYKAVAVLENLIRTRKIKFSYGNYEILEYSSSELSLTDKDMLDNIQGVSVIFNDDDLAYYNEGLIKTPTIVISNFMGEIAFSYIQFNFADIKNILDQTEELGQSNTDKEVLGYTTEYINLMNNVIKSADLSLDRIISKDSLKKYIEDEAEKIKLKIDKKSVEYMATFLRPKSWQTAEGRKNVNKK